MSKRASMTGSPDLSSSLAWRRPAFAVLAGLALALGMLAPHDAAAEQAGAVARVEIAETAIHPGAPAHCEDAELKVHPGCVACLLQLGSRTILKAPPAPPALPERDDLAAVPAAAVVSVQPRLPGPARAPPSASPFA